MARRRGARVEIIGMERLQRRLHDLVGELEAAAKAEVENSASLIVADVRRNVRVDSGNLRTSVAPTFQKEGL